jgi:hypothetical protein
MREFCWSEYLPARAVARITDARVADPERVRRVAQGRRRRTHLTRDGRLNLLAADHPGRRVTSIGDAPLRMAHRGELLARVVRTLQSEQLDGVMATTDLLEELLLLHDLVEQAGGPGFLHGKLLLASLNRGGLAGTVWEIDDPITGPGPAACQALGLDGVKILLRVSDAEAGSLPTLLASARAITDFNAAGLPTFLEPLPVTKTDSGYKVAKTPEALARLVGVAAALGDSSRLLWLKLPYCENYEVVARATTLPILLLGGESAGDPAPFLAELAKGMAAGPNVRGALVGRNVLYPGPDDPLAVTEAAGGIIHQGWSLEQALAAIDSQRGRDLDWLARYL